MPMIKTLPNLSYKYNDKVYSLNPFQQEVFQKVKSLPQKRLHYLVGQQSSDPNRPNLNLKELKYFITRGIMKYVRETNVSYHRGLENKLVKFYCVFETDQRFNETQMNDNLINQSFYLGLHFHLFFSSPVSWFDYEGLIHSLFLELTSISSKRLCLSKYDYKRIENLEDPFVLYHTKQFYLRPTKELVHTNLNN
jgi:hypothetical protein